MIKYREDKREKKAQCVKTTSYNCGLSCINVKKNCRIVPNDSRSKDRLEKLKTMGIDYAKIRPSKSKVKPTPTPIPVIPAPVIPAPVISAPVISAPVVMPEPEVKETPEQRKARLQIESAAVRQRLVGMNDDLEYEEKRNPIKANQYAIIAINEENPKKFLTSRIKFSNSRAKDYIKTNPEKAQTYVDAARIDLEPALAKVNDLLSEARKLVEVKNPSSFNIKQKGDNIILYKHLLDKGIDAFQRLVDVPKLRSPVSIVVTEPLGSRSSYSDAAKKITLGTDDPSAIVHELAHWLDLSDNGVKKEVLEFYNKRTEGEKTVKLNDVSKNPYSNDEVTKVDKWLNLYMGKVYPDKSTEILSMGLELMYKNPVYLAKKDPEMFDFIYSVVRRG